MIIRLPSLDPIGVHFPLPCPICGNGCFALVSHSTNLAHIACSNENQKDAYKGLLVLETSTTLTPFDMVWPGIDESQERIIVETLATRDLRESMTDCLASGDPHLVMF